MRYISLVTALFSTLGAAAQSYDSPATVAVGRDMPRGSIVAYSSPADAQTPERGASRYVRPVTDWQEQTSDSGRVLTGEFAMPFAWIDRELFLHIASAGSSYEVTVNGKRAGYVQDGATPADFDITKLAVEGKNRVSVTLFAPSVGDALLRTPETKPALGSCYVMAQPKMRVRDVTVGSSLADDGRSGVLSLGIVMKTHALNPKTTRIYYELIAPDSTKVLDGYKDLTLDMRREDTVRIMHVVPRAQMWSAQRPNLFTLIVKTRYEGRINEYVPVKVGFRTVSTDAGRLLVNGEAVDLHLKELDADAQPDELSELKNLGYNTLRLPTGRIDRELLDRCDSLGFYVIDQLPIDTRRAGLSRKRGGNPSNDPAWRDAYLDRTEQHYHAVKRHPSIVAFSLARESANGINLYESYLRLKELEPHRPVIYTEAGGEWNSDRLDL
ncbi:glycoside hydrolase family 2 TIM barrel-domain containing protein [Alistipes sp.]|uniref:glycoside hydrolase family 2 TIM barrel-domain containing protein n=1 Tax=Alistipes sp. TaxID=1872444 RepID=UPI003A8AE9B3